MQVKPPAIIQGAKHSDQRGTLSFWNDFDLQAVKRMYVIENADTQLLRGWRGHRIEQRWFYPMAGSFRIFLVQIDDWERPNPSIAQLNYELSAAENMVLHVPAGYASAIQALSKEAKLLILADYGLAEINDDYRFPIDYFIGK